MAIHIHRATFETRNGMHVGIVLSFDKPTTYALAAFFHLVEGPLPSGLLAFARVTSTAGDTVRLGALAVVDALDTGWITIPDGEAGLVHTPTDPPRGTVALRVAHALSFMDLAPTTAWLPLPYSFEGDEDVHDPRTGEPASASDD